MERHLEIGNNLVAGTLVVTPVLHTAAGRALALQPVSLKAQEVRTLDLAEAINSAAQNLPGSDSFGSVSLEFNSLSAQNIYAAVLIQKPGHPMNFHFDAQITESGVSSGNFESIWWLPRQTTDGYIIVSNHSASAAHGRQLWTDANGVSRHSEELNLAPYETKRFSVRQIAEHSRFDTAFGGVEMAFDSGAGQVEVSNIVFDETTDFSAILRVFSLDPATPTEDTTLRADDRFTTSGCNPGFPIRHNSPASHSRSKFEQ